MNPDREQAYELVAHQPEISLDAATVREIVEKYNCDDSPHFLATVHLAERVIQLERDNAAKAEPSPTEGTQEGQRRPWKYCAKHDCHRDPCPYCAATPQTAQLPPSNLLDWLKEAAHLLDLYHSGYCPKNVAATLLAKIRINWPDLLTPVPTREREKDAEIAALQEANFRQAEKINEITGFRNAFAEKLLRILGFDPLSQEVEEKVSIIDEVSKLAALQVSHDALLWLVEQRVWTKEEIEVIKAAEKLTGRKG